MPEKVQLTKPAYEEMLDLSWSNFDAARGTKPKQGAQPAATGAVAGYTGPAMNAATTNAIKNFQKSQGMPVTGNLDASTLSRATKYPAAVAAAKKAATAGKKAAAANKKANSAKISAQKKAAAAAKKSHNAQVSAAKKNAAAAVRATKAHAAAAKKSAAAAAKAAKAAKVARTAPRKPPISQAPTRAPAPTPTMKLK